MTEQIFKGYVALVTGAAGGIGLATANAYAEAGAAVALLDMDEAGVVRAAEGLTTAGHKALGLRCDISQEDQVKAAIEQTVSTLGGLDLACNNAGIHVPSVETADAASQDFDRAIAVNLRGVWNCMKYELAYMRQQRRGAIVNVSSNSGLAGIAGLGAYTASKHGVIGLTKSAALEYATKGIRINVVCPGPVMTPMVDKALKDHPESVQAVIDSIPLGRLGQADEIASSIIWLSSSAASFAIGSVLVVDGGYTAR
ncbi:MAG: SDR family oxidoreductase [Acidobacteriaceae bacterium]|nr:SDR family oxidoreductase [Acidobacteriaceae bacterium]